MEGVQIGCGQITWLVLKKSMDETLSDIARAGYEGVTFDMAPGMAAAETRDRYAQYGLRPAPGYLSGEFWNKSAEADLLTAAHRHASYSQALGLTELYVAAGGTYLTKRGLERRQISGHVTSADSMTDAEYKQFAETLNRVGEITLEYGVHSCFHNHVGTTIETRSEIDRLFSLTDRERVFLGPDTGHLEWAGADALEFIRDYADLIKTIHVKDIDDAVRVEGVAAHWDYTAFSKAGIWTEVGHGVIDFPTLFVTLEQAGFRGWIIVETDVTQLATAYDSALVSRQYLKSLGL